jgi:exosortase/archaeosortase
MSAVWEEIPPIDRNGIITVYEVLYVPFETFDGAISANIINTTDLSYLLESLQEYVSYNISVRAYTRVGSGPYSVPIHNQTLEACKLLLNLIFAVHACT